MESTYAPSAMAVSGHALATSTALAVLAGGGNAVDAAFAGAYVQSVTMPDMCGLGGDLFAIGYTAASGTVWTIDGSGRWSGQRPPHWVYETGRLPKESPLAVTVPGFVAASFRMLATFGTRSAPDLLAAARRYAWEGFPPTDLLLRYVAEHGKKIRVCGSDSATEHPFARIAEQRWVRQPQLGQTLDRLATEGADDFYRGETARLMVSALRATGGLLTEQDLAAHTATVSDPLCLKRGEWEIYQTGLPSQGCIMLFALRMLDCLEKEGGDGLAVRLDREWRATRAAFGLRLAHLGDSPEAARKLAHFLDTADPRMMLEEGIRCAREGRWRPQSGDTTSITTADRWGNAVTVIHSVSQPFGSGIYVSPAGFFLNNRGATGFFLTPDHPNCLAPGKRPMHTLNAFLLKCDGHLFALGNTPGGDGQPQWNLQMVRSLMGGLDPQQTVQQPRWLLSSSTDPAVAWEGADVKVEEEYPAGVISELASRGWRVEQVGRWAGGGAAQIIQRLRQGGWAGGADPRKGCSIGAL